MHARRGGGDGVDEAEGVWINLRERIHTEDLSQNIYKQTKEIMKNTRI